MTVWGRKMLELLPESEHRLIEGATRMLKATSFAADATLDGMISASRAIGFSVVARRGIWLHAWQADLHSKQLVAAYLYRGGKLFGPSLEEILVETKDKKKALPKTLRKSDQRGPSFRFLAFRTNGFQGRSQQDGKRSTWGTSRPQFKRSSFNSRPNKFPFPKGGKQDRDNKPQKA